MLFHEDSNFYEKPGVSVSCFIHNVHCLGGACGPQANIYSFPHNLIYWREPKLITSPITKV